MMAFGPGGSRLAKSSRGPDAKDKLLRTRMTRLTTLFLFLLTIMTLPAALTAQTDANKKQAPVQPEYVIRATTRLVILDIVAVDAKGNTVTDLKAEEIRVLENGKEQTKRDFTFLRPDEHAPQRVVLNLPSDVYTNVPQYKGNSSFNIILFDVLNTRFLNLAYAQDQIVSYLDKHPPTQPTALYALGNK